MTGETDCHGTHCVTCADDANPVRVLELGSDGLALCLDEAGAREEVLVDLVGPVSIGDTLLVHAGVALVRLDAEAAA